MIKISLIIKSDNNNILKFTVNKIGKLIMQDNDGNESIILENVSDEFDGICDDDGRIHFLLQSTDGALVYIKYDSDEWKKYIVFSSKSKKAKMSHIRLTWDKGILCGFYTMEYNDKIMLIKHVFSSSNLYATPEVIDVLDARKDYCLTVNEKSQTVLFYRNQNGEYSEKVFDKYFSNLSTRLLTHEREIYCYCNVYNGFNNNSIYITNRKGYTALVFSNDKTEKIISFALPKNSKPSMIALGDFIIIQWIENSMVTESVSKDGGRTFSKPGAFPKKIHYHAYRERGVKPGFNFSGLYAVENNLSNPFDSIIKESSKYIKKNGKDGRELDNNYNKINSKTFKEIEASEFMNKLSKIENEVLKNWCRFKKDVYIS